MNLNSNLYLSILRYEKIISAFFLVLSIIFIWTWYFRIGSFEAIRTPIGYQGDAWFSFAISKAYYNNEINPFLFQFVPSLNAPFNANWNDYPITEDLLFAIIGWLGRFIGFFTAVNIILLTAHILAGLSFWIVCRELKYKNTFAFTGGLIYAFCHYIMARGLGHLTLSYFWHIPFLLLILTWVYSDKIYINSNKKYYSIIIATICGVLNPYYTAMFIHFLLFCVIYQIIRKNYQKLIFCITLISSSLFAFIIMNANTILYRIFNQKNTVAGGRNLASLEVYGLKIPELFLTPGNHFLNEFVQYSFKNYYGIAFIKGEYWSPYLGFAAITGLILIIVISIVRLFQGHLNRIPLYFWFILWILLYSVVGGFNLLLGTFDIQYFRATNRYSIFILTISLLFLFRFLNRKCPKILIIPLSILLILIAFAEEFTNRIRSGPNVKNEIIHEIESDKNFSQMIEKIKPNSMVFQLPVADFPEIGPIHKMGDYEHFRPYLYTKSLHYSYGTNKGRENSAWQKNIEKLPPSEMIERLESYGFGVIIINKKGYQDNGKYLINELLKKRRCIISENKDMVSFSLYPSSIPQPIELPPFYGVGWSDNEGLHRWSQNKKVEISLYNSSSIEQTYLISFGVDSLIKRNISITLNNQNLINISLEKPGDPIFIGPLVVSILPGKNSLIFNSEKNPVSPNNGDPRLLSYKLLDFKIELQNKSLIIIDKNLSDKNERKDCPEDFFTERNDTSLTFQKGWSDDEITHRWATDRNAEIILTNSNNKHKNISLEFKISALSPRKIFLKFNSKIIQIVDVINPSNDYQFRVDINLPPGNSHLFLETDSLPIKPKRGDNRFLSFKISNLRITNISD